jgi:radical SAM protein with 4Fe4S-binding SPASM domain
VEVQGFDRELHERLNTLIQELGCNRLLLFSPEQLALSDLNHILSTYDHSILRSIDVMSEFSDIEESKVQVMVQNHPRIRSWVLYGAPEERLHFSGHAGFGQIVSYAERPDLYCDKSYVDPAYFKSNITLYTESQWYHTFFNAKLFVRHDGSILNAPSSTDVVGNIHSILKGQSRKLVENPRLTQWWSFTKSETDVCKDCEFRNMCIDSRPPMVRNLLQVYHRNECNYNPYICKWKGEDGYRNLAECGVVSNADGFTIDHDRIATINAELWGE